MTQVNTRAAHAAAVARMAAISAEADAVQAQISTSKRVNMPADDPVSFTRAAVLRRADTAATATQRGIDAASRRLSETDTALSSISDLVQRARELALQGSNDTVSADDRSILATELGQLSAQFATLADSRGSDGERLFGGAAANGPAYVTGADGVVRWAGAGAPAAVAVGGARVIGGLTGPDAFGTTDAATGSADLFATLTGLGTALTTADPVLRRTALNTALDQLDGHVTRLATARAIGGARSARLQDERDRIAKTSLATQGDLSKLEDVDMSAAIARLQRLTTVLQATQASFVKISNLSLWDQLR